MNNPEYKNRMLWVDDADREVSRELHGEVTEAKLDPILSLKTPIPCVEYVDITIPLPLRDPDSLFDNDIQLLWFRPNAETTRVADSSCVVGGILQSDMLLIGYAVRLRMSPTRFTVDGMTAEGRRAQLHYGSADAVAHFIQAYQFSMVVQQRHYIVQEALSTSAVVDVPTDELAPEDVVPVSRYVADTNKVCKDAGILPFLATSTTAKPVRDTPKTGRATRRLLRPILLERGTILHAGLTVSNEDARKKLLQAVSCDLGLDPALYHGGTFGIRLEFYGFEVSSSWRDVLKKSKHVDQLATIRDR